MPALDMNMDIAPEKLIRSATLSVAARIRMLSLPREPLFMADWLNVVMIHLELEPHALQAVTPFELDLWKGNAFVTLVAFSLRGMHPRFGGPTGRLLCKPLATHEFLNVRTYVRQDGETGIHFLGEWLNNRLAVLLGPRVFGLPYHFGRVEYENVWGRGALRGRVADARNGAALEYRADQGSGAQAFAPCAAGSLDEWLMERYTAFNAAGGRRRFFRVWHEPWRQAPVHIDLIDRGLLTCNWPFFSCARVTGANWSPGARAVWMGRPHAVKGTRHDANFENGRERV